jgi:hypothetical protein
MIESFTLPAEVDFKFCLTEVHWGKTHTKDRYYEFESLFSQGYGKRTPIPSRNVAIAN